MFISFILVKNNLEKINKINVTGLEQAYIVATNVFELTRIFGMVAFLPESELNNELKNIPVLRDKYNNALEIVKKTTVDAKGKELLEKILAQIKITAEKNNKVVEMAKGGLNGEAQVLYVKETKQEANAIHGMLNKFVMHQKEQVEKNINLLTRVNLILFLIAIALGGSAFAASIIIAKKVSNDIRISFKKSAEYIESLSKGDLTRRVNDRHTSRKDEIGVIAGSINALNKNLHSVVLQMSNGMQKLAESSEKLLNISKDVSASSITSTDRSNSVATASEEMTQTITEIAKNIVDIADNAKKAYMVADDGSKIVRKSIEEVLNIEKTINEFTVFVKALEDKSVYIGNVINTIGDIADQTNLLALNAAIEAARAGEQGRGFAVVADEVRKLAERTAQSTSDITNTIKSIQQEINKTIEYTNTVTQHIKVGVELTTQADTALAEIVQSSDELQQMIQQVASATEEMSATAEQISREILEVSNNINYTQQNAKYTLEEAQTLSQLSSTIKESIGYFNVRQEQC
jgi:methyl-accepting chemotaxis protein